MKKKCPSLELLKKWVKNPDELPGGVEQYAYILLHSSVCEWCRKVIGTIYKEEGK